MCINYTCRYKCGCLAPDVKPKPVRCQAFHENKPCMEERKTSYLSSDCGKDCPSWEDPENIYKEEYKCELADNHLYYGNKDVSQEDIFFEKDEPQPKRPQFILPSYQALVPSKPKFNGVKAKPDTLDLVDSDKSLSSTNSPEPSSPKSKSPTSTAGSVDSEVNSNAIFSSHLDTWQTRQPKGTSATIKHENVEGEK